MIPVYLALAVGSSGAEAAMGRGKNFSLRMANASLEEVLLRLGQRYGLQFIGVDCAGERREVEVEAANLSELLTHLQQVFGADGVALDGVWFVNGQPSEQSDEEVIQACVPLTVVELVKQEPPADLREQVRKLLTRRLLAMWEPQWESLAEEEWLVFPFRIEEEPDFSFVREWLLRQHTGKLLNPLLRKLLFPPETEIMGSKLKLEGRKLSLLLRGGYCALGFIPSEEQKEDAGNQPVQFPLLERYWKPWRARYGSRIVLPLPVTLSFVGSGEELVSRLKEQIPAEFLLPADCRPRRFVIKVEHMPWWLVLHGLSVVTGYSAEPYDDAQCYRLREPQTLDEHVYRLLAVEDRLLWLKWFMSPDPFTFEMWRNLREPQRQTLRAGKLLPVSELPREARLWLWRTRRNMEVDSWQDGMQYTASLLEMKSIEGSFIVYGNRRAEAAVRVVSGFRSLLPLDLPGGVPELTLEEKLKIILNPDLTDEEKAALLHPQRPRVGRRSSRRRVIARHRGRTFMYGTRTRRFGQPRQEGQFGWFLVRSPSEGAGASPAPGEK